MQVLEFESQYLDALPSGQMYERSYMHRETVTQVVVGAAVLLPPSLLGTAFLFPLIMHVLLHVLLHVCTAMGLRASRPPAGDQ